MKTSNTELKNENKSIPKKDEKIAENSNLETRNKANTKEDKTLIQADNNESILELAFKNLVLDDDENDNSTQKKTWDSLGVPENVQKGLLDMSFLQPSKIQSTVFPLIVKEPRHNIIAQSKNGSGKTGAYGISIISSIDEKNDNIQVVVFAHTRELVIQIKDVLEKIAKYTNVKVTAMLSQDNHVIDYGHIIVITPGHFENCFLRRGKHVLLDDLKMLVLDEADYMLTNEVTSNVCEKLFKLFLRNNKKVQLLFFSATFDENCFRLVKKYYPNEENLETKLKKEELTLDKVKQLYKECKSPEDKIKFIEEYLPLNSNSQRVLIFANRRDNVVNLQKALYKRGYKVYILMGGDMSFSNRDETIKKFRSGEIQILITTDLLSRGYDERLVKLVINYDIPIKKEKDGFIDVDYETYLHRIGRTGRFDTKGIGINLVCGKRDMENINKIEKYYGTKIEKMKSMDELLDDLKKCVIED